MFCPNCGKNLPDNSAFCDGCGTRLAAAPAQPAAPAYAAPAQPNPILDDTIAAFKGFFSGNPANGLQKAAKSSGLEWLILFGITVFFKMFYAALRPCHQDSEFEAFGLLDGILSSSLGFFALSFAILLLFKLAYNKDIPIAKIFNVTAYAMLPIGCSALLNIVFGFVWDGLTATITSLALIAFAVLLYVGIQQLCEIKVSVWGFIIVLGFVMLLGAAWQALWVELLDGELYGYFLKYFPNALI
ncbi:MAG: zinc ribbon domain-containing protein [Ruminococcaceae bacterium]|nr:zinc ribbon domain-containing protein [Oscillospiraceae bacterium]